MLLLEFPIELTGHEHILLATQPLLLIESSPALKLLLEQLIHLLRYGKQSTE